MGAREADSTALAGVENNPHIKRNRHRDQRSHGLANLSIYLLYSNISAEEKALLVPCVRYLAILSLGRSDTGRILLLVDPFNPRAGMLPQVTAMVEEAEWWKQLSDAMDAAPAVPDGAGPNVQ